MNIKVLRAKIDLSQKAFGEKICVKAQTIQKYESGERNIPETVQKLIRYEFAEFLPEDERLIPGAQAAGNGNATVDNEEIKRLKEELTTARATAALAEGFQQMINMQNKTIALLEDQVQLYKDRLNVDGGGNTQQTA